MSDVPDFNNWPGLTPEQARKRWDGITAAADRERQVREEMRAVIQRRIEGDGSRRRIAPRVQEAEEPAEPAIVPLLLNVADVAAALRLSRATVYKLISRGDIPSVLVGGKNRRVKASDLERYVESL